MFWYSFIMFIRSKSVERAEGKSARMTIEMQLGEDNTESNLFIQPHLQSPSCLLSFQT